jgi:hypothetical protein
MKPDIIALILFLVSMICVATVMELTKAFKPKKPSFWWLLSAMLSSICTLSVWWGVDHTGKPALLVLVLIVGYIGQYLIDMYGVKKFVIKVFNALAKKHGYEKIQESKNDRKTDI